MVFFVQINTSNGLAQALKWDNQKILVLINCVSLLSIFIFRISFLHHHFVLNSIVLMEKESKFWAKVVDVREMMRKGEGRKKVEPK